jgi:hypothetical protein
MKTMETLVGLVNTNQAYCPRQQENDPEVILEVMEKKDAATLITGPQCQGTMSKECSTASHSGLCFPKAIATILSHTWWGMLSAKQRCGHMAASI